MRASLTGLIVALIPALVSAEEVQFIFSGGLGPNADNPPYWTSTWNGPGPEPTSFQLTFDVNTLAPGNTWSGGYYNSPMGASLDSVSVSVAATDLTLSFDGKTVLISPTGSFSFDGTNLGPYNFIGGELLVSMSGATLAMEPDFFTGTTFQSVLASSPDPIGELLGPSGFVTDDGGNPSSAIFIDNSRLYEVGGGSGTPVPTPDAPILFLAGLVGLVLIHRRPRVVRSA
jgi:hypothetical protein